LAAAAMVGAAFNASDKESTALVQFRPIAMQPNWDRPRLFATGRATSHGNRMPKYVTPGRPFGRTGAGAAAP
jgi:hypothetical protein